LFFGYHPRLEKIIPVSENAIIHAFHEVGTEAQIMIFGIIKDSEMIIDVVDNGSGISLEKLARLRAVLLSEHSPQESIALYNVNQRLKLIYGEKYGLSITSEVGEIKKG